MTDSPKGSPVVADRGGGRTVSSGCCSRPIDDHIRSYSCHQRPTDTPRSYSVYTDDWLIRRRPNWSIDWDHTHAHTRCPSVEENGRLTVLVLTQLHSLSQRRAIHYVVRLSTVIFLTIAALVTVMHAVGRRLEPICRVAGDALLLADPSRTQPLAYLQPVENLRGCQTNDKIGRFCRSSDIPFRLPDYSGGAKEGSGGPSPHLRLSPLCPSFEFHRHEAKCSLWITKLQ